MRSLFSLLFCSSLFACGGHAPTKPTAVSQPQSQPKTSQTQAASAPASTSAPTSTPLCAPEEIIRINDLSDWKKSLQGVFVSTETQPETHSKAQLESLKALFSMVDLKEINALNPEELSQCPPITLERIEITPVRLQGSKEPDQLIEIELGVCSAWTRNTPYALVQVLRRVGPGAYCPLGSSISFRPMDQACLAPEEFEKQERAVAITPVHLTSSAYQDLQVVTEDGICDGIERSGHFETSFWGVKDNRLVELFHAVSFHTEYTSPTPPSQWTEAKLSLEGGFPKKIRVKEELICDPMSIEEPSSCTPSKKELIYELGPNGYNTKE